MNSTDSGVIKEDSVAFSPALDFTMFSYFISVQLHRDANTTNPEFHVVNLKDVP